MENQIAHYILESLEVIGIVAIIILTIIGSKFMLSRLPKKQPTVKKTIHEKRVERLQAKLEKQQAIASKKAQETAELKKIFDAFKAKELTK